MAVRGSARSRNWVFTVQLGNERLVAVSDETYLERVVEWCDADDLRFVQFQREQGENGNVHLQGMIVFAKKKRLSSLVAMHMFGLALRPHWEIMRSPLKTNVAYTSKEETRMEGHLPISHGKWKVQTESLMCVLTASVCVGECPKKGRNGSDVSSVISYMKENPKASWCEIAAEEPRVANMMRCVFAVESFLLS